MMTIRKQLFGVVLLLFTINALGQEKDFGIWYGVSAEHKLSKKLEIDLSTNVRTFKNASKIDEAFIEGGLTYNLYKHLGIGGSYRLTDGIENNNSYYYQHKFIFDIKGSTEPGNFSLSARFRFQIRTKTYFKDITEDHPDYTGRFKLKAVYKSPSFPLNPYVYFESFCPMFSANSGRIGKTRYSAGLDLSITKVHSVSVEYIFQRDYLPHLSDINILSVNYNIKF
jgi:hypothetical protein